MEDVTSERPQQPESMHRDWVIKGVDSATIHLLEEWLQEKAQQVKYRVPGDIFTSEIEKLLRRELGVGEVTARYKKYQEEQTQLELALIQYCKKTGYDPDANEFTEIQPDVSSDTDLSPS